MVESTGWQALRYMQLHNRASYFKTNTMFLLSDTTAVHDAGYTIGYYVGAWFPFLLLAIVATIIIINKRKK